MAWCQEPLPIKEFGAGRAQDQWEGCMPARQARSVESIIEAWTDLLDRRRAQEPSDSTRINDETALADMWNTWMREWLAANLEGDQLVGRTPQQRKSVFQAHIKRVYGSKHFVFGIWQTGLSWLDRAGGDAPELVSEAFARWISTWWGPSGGAKRGPQPGRHSSVAAASSARAASCRSSGTSATGGTWSRTNLR